jgi:hypothetical protein
MTILAIARPDGGVSIMRLIGEADAEAELAKWRSVNPAGHVGYHVIAEADIPQDRTYRNAWMSDGGAIRHDMAKARQLHRQLMRVARAPLLAALDIAYQRADEAADAAAKAQIAAQKQALRDATADPRIEAAQTPEELKAAWPQALGLTPPGR